MKDGILENPRYPIRKTPRIAVVIAAYIHQKKYADWVEDKAQSLLDTVRAHSLLDAGVEYNLIIVNHGGVENIPEIKNTGAIVIDMPNFGFSFGAWKQAWECFGDLYDYYLFTEDDIAPTYDGWLAEILTRFHSEADIGAVGNVVEFRNGNDTYSKDLFQKIGYTRDHLYNFDGSYTFTSAKILKQVDQRGGLMVLDCPPAATTREATHNECIFQLPILELGYRIVEAGGWVVHGGQIFSGNCHVEGKPAPLMNLNGRRKISAVREVFSFIP